MGFIPAKKTKEKARVAIFGQPGSGKTYTALSIATGLGDKIAVIDSEYGTSRKYSDRFKFDISVLDTKEIDDYIREIKIAEDEGYDVIIMDSITHAWDYLVQEVNELASAKFKGNTFTAWSKGTPKQRRFIEAILKSKCHMICTMRSKITYVVDKDDKGRTTIEKAGLDPQQGKNIEYEFDILCEMDKYNNMHVSKDRSGKFHDTVIPKPDKKFGEELGEWLDDGEDPNVLSDEEMQELINMTNLIRGASSEQELEKIAIKISESNILGPVSKDALREEYIKATGGN